MSYRNDCKIALNDAVYVAEFAELFSRPGAAMAVETCLSNIGKLSCHRICEDMRLVRSSLYVLVALLGASNTLDHCFSKMG